MLTSLKLGNFKAFGPSQKIPIKPITLVFGPNSAGKSSFIHSLLLLHQAAVIDGNLDVHITIRGGEEFEQLKRAFQSMVEEWGKLLNRSLEEGGGED